LLDLTITYCEKDTETCSDVFVIDGNYGMDPRSHYEVYHLTNMELSIF